MCRQNSCSHSEEETTTAEESLLIYCKPVELYNILRCRTLHNPSFLQRCLRYKVQATRKKRLRTGVVVFNYRDYKSIIRKTEVTDDFSCPFCLMHCSSFKGLRYHLSSSHDLFNFEFWATEEYQSVNVSVKFDIMMPETVADGVDPQLQTFFFCIRPRRRKSRNSSQSQKHVNIQFLEMDAPTLAMEGIHGRNTGKDDDALSCKNETDTKLFSHANYLKNGRRDIEFYDSDYPNMKGVEHVEFSDNIPGVSIAMAQSSMDQECVNSLSVIDHTQPANKMRKLTVERADSKNRLLLQKRQFYHSHRVQPMALDQVLSDTDSEDEVDDDIADFDDRRMLDDFVDVTKDEKKLMHLWNSFVRKQRVLADGHVSWACEAFSKLHGLELISSPSLFWCWRLFMIKLWNHGLLDSSTMNKCNATLEGFRDQPLNPIDGLGSRDASVLDDPDPNKTKTLGLSKN